MSLATVTLAQNKAAEVKATLAQNQAKIRSCQQQARRQAKSLLQGGLSCAAVRRVLAVYAVSEWDLGLAVQAAQRLSSLATSDARFPTSESVRTLFTEHDLDDLLQLFDDGHALWVPARKFASQFLREHDMFRWIKHLNLSQGVAPSAAEVYDFHESKLFGCTPCGQPRKRTVNKFVARFRARWAVRRGRLRATDAVDPDLLRQKADIVWINVDETCVACSPACPTGCVVGAHCWKTHPANAHMRVKKDTSRKTFTYVAMIASRPCIQAALPHFLVCSESRMPKLVARAFKALPPSRLQLLRGKSSWVTAETFVTILTELQKALQPWLPAVKPILLLDCACPHLPKKVLSFAQKKGLQLLFVPSCGTSTCHQNSRALTCFMSLATVTLAQNKAAEVKATLAQNQAKIRSCQQQARRQAKSLLQGGLSCAAVRRVLAVYAVSEWDLGLAVQAAQRLSSLATSDARFPTSESVRTLFTEHDLDDLLQLFDDGHALWVPARKFASQFLREHDMFRWIKHLNLSQGVAPSAAEVYDFHESKLFGCTPCGQPRKRTVNKFVARFRARWAVRRGRLRATDAVDPDLLRQKAVLLFRLQGLFL
ncbi:unnamed protein product [Cladocopium goreaui]|uniref:DDE-1 domain-containing protein n=1 Tax=Cladocopium goreaui TaxID=2562237 RepID=A0A9P1GEN2_9DINO|nr:unnamed protein product [Cladocopium goreaui]